MIELASKIVISREKDLLELVYSNGVVVRVKDSGGSRTLVHRPLTDLPSFAQRPRSFLSDLRTRRDIDLAERLKKKRREARLPREPKTEKGSRPTSKRKSLKTQADEAAASLPAAIRELLKMAEKPSKGKK